MILFVTSSHSQEANVFEQFVAISEIFVPLNINFTYICVESSTDSHSKSLQYSHLSPFTTHFKLLNTDQSNFWCGSLFFAVSYICDNLSYFDSCSRVVMLNSDVILSDFNTILLNHCLLESYVTYFGDRKLIGRSGFNQLFPCLPIHEYPFFNKQIDSSQSFFCEIVPTRCISLPFSVFLKLQDISWLPNFLPHYGADFIVTKYISFIEDAKWFVRNDAYLFEDYSSTGLKPSNSCSIATRLASIFNCKSVFNWRLFVIYPIIFCFLFLPFPYWLIYSVFYWFKFLTSLFFLKP